MSQKNKTLYFCLYFHQMLTYFLSLLSLKYLSKKTDQTKLLCCKLFISKLYISSFQWYILNSKKVRIVVYFCKYDSF